MSELSDWKRIVLPDELAAARAEGKAEGIAEVSGALDAARSAIAQLESERDQLTEQLAIRSESGMAKDMQEIMRINNELKERIAELETERSSFIERFMTERATPQEVTEIAKEIADRLFKVGYPSRSQPNGPPYKGMCKQTYEGLIDDLVATAPKIARRLLNESFASLDQERELFDGLLAEKQGHLDELIAERENLLQDNKNFHDSYTAERQRRESAEGALWELQSHWPRWRGVSNPGAVHLSRYAHSDDLSEEGKGG